MALDSWIDSATLRPARPVGADRLMDAHLLAMPAVEREYALKERERARRAVRRIAGDEMAADELLAMLGLTGETS